MIKIATDLMVLLATLGTAINLWNNTHAASAFAFIIMLLVCAWRFNR